MIVDENIDTDRLGGEEQSKAILRFKGVLKPHKSVGWADIYREIALVCDRLNLNNTAYRLMKLAQINRPDDPKICEKLAYLKEKHVPDRDESFADFRYRVLEAMFIDQTIWDYTKTDEIRVSLRKLLKISRKVESFVVLRELAFFCEHHNEIEAAYLLISLAKNKKPIDKELGEKCVQYANLLGNCIASKRPIVYLHMGANKTASTSIQCTLFKNREVLKDMGEGYLFSKAWGLNKTKALRYLCVGNHIDLKVRIKKKFGEAGIVEYNRQIMDDLIAEVGDYKGRNFIFSGEDLFRFRRNEMNRLREMLEWLIPNCEIKVIFVIRNFISYMNSSTQQAAKGGRIEREVLRTRLKKGEFFKIAIANISHIFGADRLMLYTFEESLKHTQGPVGFLLEQIGLDEEMIHTLTIQRKNESLSDRATKMIFWLNKISAKLDGVAYNDNSKIHGFNNKFTCISGTARYTLDKKIIKKFYPIMNKEARWLKRSYSIDYTDYRKKTKDVPVVFDETFEEEMKEFFVNRRKVKRYLLYVCFVEQSKSWKQDPVSKETFASLVRWCEENDPEVTQKNYLEKLGRKAV